MRTQVEKGRLFQELHQRRGILILPNPWDAGTAKLLASVGFEALATTSLGMSNALGRVDGEGSVSRAELLENCRIIAEATDLPVNADLENGYADDPQEAATILSKTVTPMIRRKPQPSYATRRRWVLLGALSRIGAASASMISTTRSSALRQASRWPVACRCRSPSSRGPRI